MFDRVTPKKLYGHSYGVGAKQFAFFSRAVTFLRDLLPFNTGQVFKLRPERNEEFIYGYLTNSRISGGSNRDRT